MTTPLTPPECDLQDFPFMPLHVARLRDSDLAAEESPESCWYAVLLWAASWHQVPAASLPDNDAVLAKLIGLGRDVRTFRRHKAAAMRGFVLCDDGRLYHEVVAEQALVAWEGKLQQRWRTECARIKKYNQRNHLNHKLPTFEEFLSPEYVAPGPRNVPDVVPEDMAACPPGQSIQEKGKEKGTGKEEEIEAPQVLPFPSPEGGQAARTRGARLKADWRPSADNVAYAVGQGFTEGEVGRIAENFRDYWIAASGRNAVKLDWSAAWRTWVRSERDRRGGAAPRQQVDWC